MQEQPLPSISESKMTLDSSQRIQESKNNHTIWNIFEQTLFFVSLYIMAISIGFILHYYVDRWLPLNFEQLPDANRNIILIKLSFIIFIVSFSLYSFLVIRNLKRVQQNISPLSLRIKKQFAYATLIIAAVIILFNLLQAISRFFNGGIETNILFHILVTVGLCLIIFFLNFKLIQQDKPHANIIYFSLTFIAVIIMLLIYIGFYTNNSFASITADQNRFFDYSILSNGVNSYFVMQGRLPTSLSELEKLQSPHYPINEYQYDKTSDTSYNLCTSFSTDKYMNQTSSYTKLYYPTESNFEHKKGRDCMTYYIQDYMLPLSKLMPVDVPTNDSIFKSCNIIYDSSKAPIEGVYELDNAVVFTKNKVIKNVYLEYWMAGSGNNSHLTTDLSPLTTLVDTRNTLNNRDQVILQKGMEYKLITYNNNENTFSTQTYSFQGNRIVVKDSRCLPLQKSS